MRPSFAVSRLKQHPRVPESSRDLEAFDRVIAVTANGLAFTPLS
jgi:hypothetical protein